MRKDVFTGSWVIMAETDTVRPSDFHSRDSCGKRSSAHSAKPTRLLPRTAGSPVFCSSTDTAMSVYSTSGVCLPEGVHCSEPLPTYCDRTLSLFSAHSSGGRRRKRFRRNRFVSLSARIALHIQLHQFHYRAKCGTKPMLPMWSGGCGFAGPLFISRAEALVRGTRDSLR